MKEHRRPLLWGVLRASVQILRSLVNLAIHGVILGASVQILRSLANLAIENKQEKEKAMDTTPLILPNA